MFLIKQDSTDGNPNQPISVNTTLHIEVGDVDDLNPVFQDSSYQASIDENETGLLNVTPAVFAYDPDVGAAEDIEYSCKL